MKIDNANIFPANASIEDMDAQLSTMVHNLDVEYRNETVSESDYASQVTALYEEFHSRITLADLRRLAANREFDSFDFTSFTVQDYGPWETESFDGTLTQPVYFSYDFPRWQDGPSGSRTVKGQFTVRFFPNSDAVMDTAATINGNEIIPA
jgi:hypothetical protein